ncbi:MAG: tetratricopeptide repeat protein, partial [Pleurocapsa sp.]
MLKTPITTVCVLGMQRSGTSCLAGSLQAAGLPGGKVMKYCIHNTKGSRENQSINDLNESIFTSNNGSWYSPPATIKYSTKHQQHRNRIVADLNSQFPVWMFKDPRTVLTLPFWQEKIPNLQLIASFRQPLKVAMSLYQRQSLQIPLREGIKLWIYYNSLILEAYKQKSFPLICFDSPQDEYLTQLSKIVNLLNNRLPHNTQLSSTKVKDFYESKLVHQEKATVLLPNKEDQVLLEKAELLYQELRIKAGISGDFESNKNTSLCVSLEEDSTAYLQALKTQPSNAQLYFMLAKAQEDEGDIEAAISSSRTAFSLDCYSVDITEQLSRLLSHIGDFAEAISLIESLIKHQPYNPRLYINLGNVQRSQRDFASAVLTFQKVLELIPEDALSLTRVCDILIQDNRIEEAILNCQKTLELYPQDTQVYFSLGRAYEKQDNLEQAIICYQKSIDFCTLSPGNVYFHLGNIFKKQNNSKEAFHAYKNAIRFESKSYYGYLGLANYYQEQNKWEQASPFYQKAIELECTNPQAYFLFGQNLQKQEKWQEAATAYEKTFELHAQHFQANIELASCYSHLEKWDKAIQIYQKLIKLNPQNSKAYLLLGEIFVRQESWEEAKAAYEKTVELHSQNFQANIELASCYSQLKQWDKT